MSDHSGATAQRQGIACSGSDADTRSMDSTPHMFGLRDSLRLRIVLLALALPSEGVLHRWNTERKCQWRLGEVRWPDGPRCDRCGGDDVAAIHGRVQFRCRACERQFTLLTGTPLERSTTCLRTWFQATKIFVRHMADVLPGQDPLYLVTGRVKHLRVSRTTAMRIERIVRADISTVPPPGTAATASFCGGRDGR